MTVIPRSRPPQVVYSIGAKFAGGGIGVTSYHGVRGLYRHNMLRRLLCGSFAPSEIPRARITAMGFPSRALRKLAVYDNTRWLSYLHDILYDAWASRHLEPADIFHGWGNFSWRSMRRAKTQGAITVVQRASSHPAYQARLLREEYARWGLTFKQPRASIQRALKEIESADYVLIPSDFVRQSFIEQGVPEEKLLQIPFGVDIHRFRPMEHPGQERPFRVLFVGQVSLQKGIMYLLEAWKALRWQDAELWIVGRTDPEMRPLLQQCPPGTFRQFGYVSDPVSIYQQADVFAFPSLQEGSALVTYEALACGLPVVTTPHAGSVVRDGVDGFIVPIRDAEALAGALERLRRDDKLRHAFSVNARRRAEMYTWRRHEDALADAYVQQVWKNALC